MAARRAGSKGNGAMTAIGWGLMALPGLAFLVSVILIGVAGLRQ